MFLKHQDVILKFSSPSQWKELSKEIGSEILPSRDGSRVEDSYPELNEVDLIHSRRYREVPLDGKWIKKDKKEAKTVQQTDRTKESRKRVKKQPKIKAGSADTARKEVKSQNNKAKGPKVTSVQSLEAYLEF
ncbi:hypothetical protein Tco_1093310 [Tanacetum coccineum]|uniref:Uncharacterized protein n=1 Tax=Tanacetum coccineum TaxID=301880 RepID=A0ABQ5IES7_9ASTR